MHACLLYTSGVVLVQTVMPALAMRDALDRAALHQDRAVLAVAVEDVVDRPLVVALEHPDIIDILVEKGFVAYLRNRCV